MFAPQQEHCQCAAFIGRSIRTAGSRWTCMASTPSSCAALKTARSLWAAKVLRAPWSALGCVHSERRSDFHCVLNHRGRRRRARNMDRLSRTIISAICWSLTHRYSAHRMWAELLRSIQQSVQIGQFLGGLAQNVSNLLVAPHANKRIERLLVYVIVPTPSIDQTRGIDRFGYFAGLTLISSALTT